jgi:hypothetical protein
MQDPSDPVEAARLINDDIRSWFSFDERYYFHPTDQGLAEMLSTRMGRCEDMTNLTIYAMRANGLAVTSDYTPHWANAGNNHAWNAILTRDGRVVPFMGAEAHPGEYRLRYRAAKVYRKMFAQQKDNLAFQRNENEKVPSWLSGKSYIDVTSDYTDVSDVVTRFEQPVPDSIYHSYLCVFNTGEWKAIHWAAIEGQQAVFTDMGCEVVYLLAFYINETLEPAGPPFILQKDRSVRYLVGHADSTITVHLTATEPTYDVSDTEGAFRLTPGTEYELFYWQDGWQSLGTSVATELPLESADVPAGRLYWLVASGSDKEERIFTVEDSGQVWW